MLHEMLQFEMPINPYKIVLGYNVTKLKVILYFNFATNFVLKHK